MTTLHFVRHGETDWNRLGRFQGSQDIPLNEEGRSQARRLARLWDRGGDRLIASPLSRARETAEILAAGLGSAVLTFDPRLVERSYGMGEGLTVAERQERWPDGQVPGIEAPEALRARALDFLEAVTLEHPGRTVVVVSHGGFINTVLSVVSGGRFGTGKTTLGNGSISTVTLGADGWSVLEVARSYEAHPLGLQPRH